MMIHFSYHPLAGELDAVLEAIPVERGLVIDDEVTSLYDRSAQVRTLPSDEVGLPSGLYTFNGVEAPLVMQVSSGPAGPSSELQVSALDEAEADPLVRAYHWAERLWESASPVPAPQFAIGDRALTVPGGADVEIRGRSFLAHSWAYNIRGPEGTQTVVEHKLTPVEFDDQPENWIKSEPASAARLGATLTRVKLQGKFADTVYSFQATRTVFRPYQFKPVLKLLQSGHARLLIADEVGLGKTIEAGLIWTELEARHDADRVLIVCPSGLVDKWRDEMQERFGFDLTVLNRQELERFREQHREGKTPKRRAYVASLETLRSWRGLEEFREHPPEFDLVIVDEAHSMRNSDTKSHLVGQDLSEWTTGSNMVFLTATPINLRETDLLNLLGLLDPGDFSSREELEARLAPNAVLNTVAKKLTDPQVTWSEIEEVLSGLQGQVLEKTITSRPEYQELLDVLKEVPLTPRNIALCRQLLSKLNALSTTVTRTRRAEVDERKALRRANSIEVVWNEEESAFYEEYLQWCAARAKLANTATYFAMQMPIRLASTSVHLAAQNVLREDERVFEGDTEEAQPKNWLEPHEELVTAAKAVLATPDTKLQMLGGVLEELHNLARPSLLFTWSKGTLRYLQEAFADRYRIAVLNGDVPRNQRRRIMKDFREGGYDFLFANRVASEGLDFEFCSAVINYDLPWNPMEVEQRIGRIDRIGQESEVLLIRNFYNDEAIDARIMHRVLERINIFEESIGELEPIIGKHSEQLHAAMDFTLTEEEREAKAQQFLTAIETQKNELRNVADSSAALLISNDVEIAGLEEELIASGRYLGAIELAYLLDDWSRTEEGGGIHWLDDGETLEIRGNAAMARRVTQLTARGLRTAAETRALVAELQNQSPILLSTNHEIARTSDIELLSATHPLVIAATEVPGHRQARFASLRIPADENTEPGSYVVVLAHAQNASRGGDEIWGSAVREDGTHVGTAPADSLLSALARGLLTDGPGYDTDTLAQVVQRAKRELEKKHRLVQEERDAEEQRLAEAQRALLTDQHERKLAGIERRMNTIRQNERGPEVVRMVEGQRRRQTERHQQLLAEIETREPPAVALNYLAACYLEVAE